MDEDSYHCVLIKSSESRASPKSTSPDTAPASSDTTKISCTNIGPRDFTAINKSGDDGSAGRPGWITTETARSTGTIRTLTKRVSYVNESVLECRLILRRFADRQFWFACPYADDKTKACQTSKRAMVQLEKHIADYHLKKGKSWGSCASTDD